MNNQEHSKYDDNKVCVYAICKNELQFVARWLESMSEADYIVVLDTGSTDGTFEALQNDPRVHKVGQKVIDPWRFDVARNESMALIPSDANILLCTDLDEVLEPGWAKIIKNNWVEGLHVRGYYKYAWSHTSEGAPGRIFYYDKLHDRHWHWKGAVHEYLVSDKHIEGETFNPDIQILDLFDKGVYLHHYPDHTKSRGSYLPLLKVRVEEDPQDYYAKYYLAHEYHYRGYYHESTATLIDILENHRDKYSQLEVAACYLFLGDNYRSLGQLHEAIMNYNKAIEIEPSYREPYLLAAEVFNQLSQHRLAVGYVKAAIENTHRHYTWVERDAAWREQIDDILSVSLFYLGKREEARMHAITAHHLNPSDERIKYNLDLMM